MKPKPNTRGGWLKNPRQPREGETIGGGYFVFRRGEETNRIRPAQWPFEYASVEEALKQAHKLALENPGFRFIVVSEINAYQVDRSAEAA